MTQPLSALQRTVLVAAPRSLPRGSLCATPSRTFSSLPEPPEPPDEAREPVSSSAAASASAVAGEIRQARLRLRWNFKAYFNVQGAGPQTGARPVLRGVEGPDARLRTFAEMYPDRVTPEYRRAGHAPQYHLTPEQFASVAARNPLLGALARKARFQGDFVYPDVLDAARELARTGPGRIQRGFSQAMIDALWMKHDGFESRELVRSELLAAIRQKGGAVVIGYGQLTAADSGRRGTENGSLETKAGLQMLKDHPEFRSLGILNAMEGRQPNGLVVIGAGDEVEGNEDWVWVFDGDAGRPIFEGKARPSEPAAPELVHHMFRLVHVDSLIATTAPAALRPMLLVPNEPFQPGNTPIALGPGGG